MSLIGFLIVINAPALARFFLGSDEIAVLRTTEFTYIMGAMLPLLGVDMAIGGSLRGAGDTRFPLITSFLGLIGVRCALAATFAVFHLPVIWVYSSIIGDYMLKGSMLIWRFKSGHWKHALAKPLIAAHHVSESCNAFASATESATESTASAPNVARCLEGFHAANSRPSADMAARQIGASVPVSVIQASAVSYEQGTGHRSTDLPAHRIRRIRRTAGLAKDHG